MTAGIVAIVWLGGKRVLAGALTVGTFVAYLELFGRFVTRSYRIPQLVNSVQSGAAAYARLEPLLSAPLGVQGEPPYASFRPNRLLAMDAESGCSAPTRRQTGPVGVTIGDATFSYPGSAQPAFEDLALEIPAGTFVAVTGPVGAGKSALARCLAGGTCSKPARSCLTADRQARWPMDWWAMPHKLATCSPDPCARMSISTSTVGQAGSMSTRRERGAHRGVPRV